VPLIDALESANAKLIKQLIQIAALLRVSAMNLGSHLLSMPVLVGTRAICDNLSMELL
jgi:hypothetical protein